MFLERISNFLVKNRKKIFFYSLFAIFIFIALHDISFAGDAAHAGQSTGTSSDSDKTDRISILNTMLASISAIAGVMIYFVTMILDPNFTNGSTFGIDTKLHEVWILVSNIVYFIFAFILIWIAFMNIIGKGDKWELKQAMPKFIVGVLIVPFSWFIVSLVVSLSNILTIAALQLPSDSFPDFGNKLGEITLKTDCKLDFKKLSSGEDSGSWYGCSGDSVSLGDSVKNSAFGLVSAYVYGLIKIDDLPKIKEQQLANKVISNLLDMILFIVFNLLFILVFFILIIALGIVLLVRVIWLWIYMALSPLFGLAYFFGKDGGGDLMKKFNFTEFLGLAMVPVYTMLALSFGFVFLSVTMEGLDEAKTQGNKSMFKIEKNTINFKPGIKDKKGNYVTFKFKVTGGPFSQLTKEPKGDEKDSFMTGLKGSALGFVGAIFMNIFGVVIFRIAIMAALQSSSITKQIVAPIKQFGDSVGSLVAKAPTYAPVFGGKSAAELGQAASTFQGSVTSYYSGKGSKLGTSLAEKAGFTQTETRKIIEKLNSDYKGPADVNSNITVGKQAFEELYKVKSKSEFERLKEIMIEKKMLDAKNANKITWDKKNGNPKDFAKLVFDATDKVVRNNSNGELDALEDFQRMYTNISTKPNVGNKDSSSTSGTTGTQTSKAEIKLGGVHPVLDLGNYDIVLGRDKDGKFNINDYDYSNLKSAIEGGVITKDIMDHFSSKVIDKLKKEFKDEKFPWELKKEKKKEDDKKKK